MTYGELRNQIGVPGPHPFLYCQDCGRRYSANKGDYFWADPSAVIECCCAPMILATERVQIVPVARKEGTR